MRAPNKSFELRCPVLPDLQSVRPGRSALIPDLWYFPPCLFFFVHTVRFEKPIYSFADVSMRVQSGGLLYSEEI